MKHFYPLLVSTLLLFSVQILAQTAEIKGKVVDKGGSLIGATVIATNSSTGQETGVITNENGDYSIDGLNSGSYSLTISYIGYIKQTIENIEVAQGVVQQNIDLVSDVNSLNEIQITARKRVESLNLVPISLTAFVADEMAEMNVGDMYDIGKNVPNFTVNNFGNGNLAHAGLFIRGIGTQDHWMTTDPGVGAYLDGVYLGRQMGANLTLSNIKQVEVARGPQGSLFGRNSLGGAVNFITRKPDDAPFTKIQLKGGSLGRLAGDIYTSHKLGDSFSLSLSGAYNKRDGVGDFTFAQNQLVEVGEIKQRSFRVAASFNPTDKLSLLAAYDYSNDVYGQQSYFLELYPESFLESFTFDADPDNSASLAESIQRATYKGSGISFTANYDVSDATSLKLITSRRDGDYKGGLDLDGDITFTFPEVGSANQNTLELQLSSSFDKVDLVAGLYYFDEEADAISDFDFGSGNNRPLDGFQETISKAVYTHLTFDLAEDLALSTGLRYTIDDKKANAALGIFGDATPSSPTRAFGEEDWNALTWDVALNYKLASQQSIYGLVSRGYQNGGFPARAGFGPIEAFVPFDEQYATNFEVGYKGRPSNKVQIGLSAFYVKYTDLQLVFNQAFMNAFITVTENAGESQSFGMELDGLFLLGNSFRIRTNIGYLDSEVTQIDDGVIATKVGDIPIFSPKLTMGISPQFFTELPNESFLKFTLSYSYRGSMHGQSLNTDENLIDSRGLLDLNVGYTFKDSSWSVELYGENLTNEIYDNARTDNAGIMANQVISSNDRREFGVKLIKTFGDL